MPQRLRRWRAADAHQYQTGHSPAEACSALMNTSPKSLRPSDILRLRPLPRLHGRLAVRNASVAELAEIVSPPGPDLGGSVAECQTMSEDWRRDPGRIVEAELKRVPAQGNPSAKANRQL